MNTNSALRIAHKSAILLAALCTVSIAATAFASTPIKGIVVKGGCNPTPCGHCKCDAQNDTAPATDPNMPGDPVTDAHGATAAQIVSPRDPVSGLPTGKTEAVTDPSVSSGDANGDGVSDNLPVIHAMAINEKGTPGTKSNTTKKGNARTASGDPDDADADGDAASATAERHDVHPIKWTPANAARCESEQADSSAQVPVDPKNPSCVLKTRTKSNQANE